MNSPKRGFPAVEDTKKEGGSWGNLGSTMK